ncbi:hypothetical protein ACSQ67_006000 [Phaseolus vulgaris]
MVETLEKGDSGVIGSHPGGSSVGRPRCNIIDTSLMLDLHEHRAGAIPPGFGNNNNGNLDVSIVVDHISPMCAPGDSGEKMFYMPKDGTLC